MQVLISDVGTEGVVMVVPTTTVKGSVVLRFRTSGRTDEGNRQVV